MAQLKSVRRRAFRHSAWLFARVLILPGVEEYLRQAFREDPELDECLSDDDLEQLRRARKIISDAYRSIDESALPIEMQDWHTAEGSALAGQDLTANAVT